MKKERLDLFLVEQGLFESRSKAQAVIMAGEVLVDDQKIDKPALKQGFYWKTELENDRRSGTADQPPHGGTR